MSDFGAPPVLSYEVSGTCLTSLGGIASILLGMHPGVKLPGHALNELLILEIISVSQFTLPSLDGSLGAHILPSTASAFSFFFSGRGSSICLCFKFVFPVEL
jgi:hypothetical protein